MAQRLLISDIGDVPIGRRSHITRIALVHEDEDDDTWVRGTAYFQIGSRALIGGGVPWVAIFMEAYAAGTAETIPAGVESYASAFPPPMPDLSNNGGIGAHTIQFRYTDGSHEFARWNPTGREVGDPGRAQRPGRATIHNVQVTGWTGVTIGTAPRWYIYQAQTLKETPWGRTAQEGETITLPLTASRYISHPLDGDKELAEVCFDWSNADLT